MNSLVMKLTPFILSAMLISALGCGKKESHTKFISGTSRANVLFIIVDDLNDWTGFLQGHPQTMTPNMDRLASQGTVFTNAHTNSPLCGPSRSSLLTGLRPSSTGIYFHINDNDLVKLAQRHHPETVLLPDYFEQQGYVSLGVGKIFHNGDKAQVFDHYGGLADFGPRPAKRFVYDPEHHGKPKGTSTDWGAFPAHDSLTFDARIADWAIAQLQKEHKDPFFLAAGFMRPHVPWYVPQKWLAKYDSLKIDLPKYDPKDWSDIPDMAQLITNLPTMPDMDWMLAENRWEDAVKAYLASVHFVDHHIGRLLDALKKSPYAHNTFVVLTSDHGYHLGEKGLFQKSTLWERSTHVPMIWYGPGIHAQNIDVPVSLLDIYPTLLDMFSMPQNEPLEGTSLHPLLVGIQDKNERSAVTTYGPNNHSVIYNGWHYIQYNDKSEELYHLESDPHESINLATDPESTKTLKAFQKHLPQINLKNSTYSSLHTTPFFTSKE
ncbi:MAG: sulfatase [Bacteroidota bacterium]